MSNKLLILLVLIILIGLSERAWSLRISFPPTLSYPITEDQIGVLNKYLKSIWDMQSGRFELDTVPTSKSNAKNGEIWINSTTHKLQWKEGGIVYSAP